MTAVPWLRRLALPVCALSYHPSTLTLRSIHSAFILLSPAVVRRLTTNSAPTLDVDSRLRSIADAFAAARLDIDDAKEALSTTYFHDDYTAAKESVDSTAAAYHQLCEQVDTPTRQRIIESWERRIQQLIQELKQVEHDAAD